MSKNRKEISSSSGVSSNKVSEFFLHLMTYGGFDFNKGTIHMWGDPYLFIPIEAFYDLQDNLYKKLGQDGLDILYWIGKVTGKNATIALIKKYGFDIKDLPMFVNGATQDGFGYFSIRDIQIDKEPKIAHLNSINCSVAEEYNKNKKRSKIAVDSYISGLLAGGSEPLMNFMIKSKEIECRARGNDECLFELTQIKTKEVFPFMKKVKMNFEDLEKKSLKLYLSRKKNQSVFGSKEFPVDFGKGTFYLNNTKGGVIASYIMSIFYVTLQKLLSKEDYSHIIDSFCETSIKSISKKIKIPNKFTEKMNNLKKELNMLDIFGFGNFTLKYSKMSKLIIENVNNNYPIDYISLFGYSKEPTDIIPQTLIKHFLKLYLNKEISVKEITCRSQRAKSCLFEVKYN